MSTSYKGFSKELAGLKKEIKAEIVDVQKTLVEEIFLGLQGPTGTPVDTGWARAGWRISLNEPTSGTVGETGNVGTSMTASKNSLKRFLNRKFLTNVSHIFIDNRVPYLEELSMGTSKKVPKNWIDLAVQGGFARMASKRLTRN